MKTEAILIAPTAVPPTIVGTTDSELPIYVRFMGIGLEDG